MPETMQKEAVQSDHPELSKHPKYAWGASFDRVRQTLASSDFKRTSISNRVLFSPRECGYSPQEICKISQEIWLSKERNGGNYWKETPHICNILYGKSCHKKEIPVTGRRFLS
jgi:hypothetical protein